MDTPATQKRTAMDRWRLATLQPDGVELRRGKAVLQLRALSPDLLRLQASHSGGPLDAHSEAVVPQAWPDPGIAIESNTSHVHVRTPQGGWSLDLKSGGWQVKGRDGLVLFDAACCGLWRCGESLGFELHLEPGEAIFGLGETTGQFDRRGTRREFWNIDVLGHAPTIHPGLGRLYVSIPFALSWRTGRCAGLFWDNPRRQIWDIGLARHATWELQAEGGPLDLYFYLGPSPESVVCRHTQLTGLPPLPPHWALGYHQSRYSYQTAAEVRRMAREFRRRRLPCDALYLDIHHMDGYRVFTFGKAFQRPKALAKDLAREGFQLVAIVDPGVKNDPEFGVLQRGVQVDAFVKQADGVTDQLGEVWPGESRFPDFFNPRVRTWWGVEQQALLDVGIAGIWNDMNEPANFARPDKTLPPDAQHQTPQGSRPHAAVHNLYGMRMAQASFEGMRAARPGCRPFVVTRAGYAGVQRYGVVWTGDTSSNWDHLNDAVQMLCHLSLSGVSFCGADVGGFLDNATPELFARWFQFAAFTPFFRSHTNIGTVRQEPWAFGPEVENLCRNMLDLRYRWLPWFYCLCAEAHRSGKPWIRPLMWMDPSDEVAVRCGDQFLVGDGVLVAPVLRQGARARSVYLPTGLWYDYWTGAQFEGRQHIVAQAALDCIPIYIRAGTLIPMGPVLQSTTDRAPDTVELHVWVGGDGELEWYEDDGKALKIAADTAFEQHWTWRATKKMHRLEADPPRGAFHSGVREWRLTVHGLDKAAVYQLDDQPPCKLAANRDGSFSFTFSNSPDKRQICIWHPQVSDEIQETR